MAFPGHAGRSGPLRHAALGHGGRPWRSLARIGDMVDQ